MICMVLSTVVYCATLWAQISSCTSRTVLGPCVQRTLRISSSASVGFGGDINYEEITTNCFVASSPAVYQTGGVFGLQKGSAVGTNSIGTCLMNVPSQSAQWIMPACSDGM